MELAGKVALITGASSGIGYATALALAARGVHVVGTARQEDRLRGLIEAVNALPNPHGDVLTFTADVSLVADMHRVVSAAVERFGRLDILVANAGIGHRGSIVDAAWCDLETLLRTNIDGVLHSVRAVVPEMRKVGGGHIVIVSSVVAPMITPFAAAYSASKAFVSSIARALRYELEADGIGVSDILVGRTATAFNQKRLGDAGYGSNASRLPMMSAEYVAVGIVRAIERNQGTVILRWFDRLIVWVSTFLPHLLARRAMRQYK